MPERVVSVKLQAKVDGFVSGMRKAKASLDDVSKADVKKPSEAFSDLADKSALMSVAVGAGIATAVKRFADFDEAMSAVKANSGATGAELEALRATAVKLGADSQFSATEAAQGINELAKAGVDTADILGGGLKGSLDLAAAGQIDVATAAETAASAMTQFGLSGDKTSHVADLLTNGANKAQGGVLDLGQALNQAGLVAASTGLSIEETTAGLTAFASAGLIGSDAGTSFKTMLQRLSAPTKESKALMSDLGISAYNANGQFVGLANVAGQLQTAFEGKTDAERNSALATIFGADAIRAANVLYKQGAAGINQWTTEVTEQGAAAKQAATLTDNLKGDVERLGGAMDSVFISTGSAANGSLRTLVQGAQSAVEWVGKIPGPVLLAGSALAGIALGAPKALLAIKQYRANLDTLGLSFDKISTKAPRVAKSLEVAGRGLKGLAAGATAVSVLEKLFGPGGDGIGAEQLTKSLVSSTDAVDAFSKSIAAYADKSSNWFNYQDVRTFGDALNTVFDPSAFENYQRVMGTIAGFGNDTFSDIAFATDRLKELDAELGSLVEGGNADEAARQFEQYAAAAVKQGISVDQLKTKFPGYEEALAGVDNASTLATASGNTLTDTTNDLQASADNAKEALKALSENIEGLGQPVADQREAARAYQEAIDAAAESVKKNGKTLNDSTAAGRANAAALDAIRDATMKKVTADYAVNGSTDAATAAMQEGRDAFVKAAIAAGKTKTEAEALATALGLVPKDVAIVVQESGAAGAKEAIDAAARDRRTTIKVRYVTDGRLPNGGVNLLGGSTKNAATGGAIFGPGTGTSDSIPAWLSNGEHVLTAAEVVKMGGHAAVYAMRQAVKSGWRPGFAAGGAVTPSFAPAVQYVRTAGPVASAPLSLDGMSIEGRLEIEGGLTGFVRGVVRETNAEQARAIRSGRGTR